MTIQSVVRETDQSRGPLRATSKCPRIEGSDQICIDILLPKNEPIRYLFCYLALLSTGILVRVQRTEGTCSIVFLAKFKIYIYMCVCVYIYIKPFCPLIFIVIRHG